MSIFKERSVNTALPVLIGKMRNIVQAVIVNPKFRSDFEINDRTVLERCSKPGTFAWYVYDCGTHLFPLNDKNQVATFQREWIESKKALEGKKGSSEDRLYVFNVFTGDFRRVYEFKTEKNLADHLLKSVG